MERELHHKFGVHLDNDMDYRITLVLGAGASVAMGYPIGNDLRKSIIERSISHYQDVICSLEKGIYPEHLDDFVETFRLSQMQSIDAFLARRHEYEEIGKRSIAAILLDAEDVSRLSSCEHEDHWYFYFFNIVAAAHDWDSLSLKDIAIITFNYDRSFEHYLISAFTNAYGRSVQEVIEKISEMKIIHVYGMLGSCNPQNQLYFPYGYDISLRTVDIAASMLKVIPEGRQNDQSLEKSREILSRSAKIAFLGFGFDSVNLERLDSINTCAEIIIDSANTIHRKIVGTSLGMTKAESDKAVRETARHTITGLESSSVLHHVDCLRLLRQTLILT